MSFPRTVLALNTSAEFREKTCKAVQYAAKLLAASGHGGALADSLAKSMSSARRLIAFLRWVKYLEELRALSRRGQCTSLLRGLQISECVLNLSLDAISDVITLDKLGLLAGRKLPRLGRWTLQQLAEALDVLLASVGIAISVINLRAALATRRIADKDGTTIATADVGMSKQRIALLKYICDFVKNVDAAGMGGRLAPGDRLGALGGVVGALISAQKLADSARAFTSPIASRVPHVAFVLAMAHMNGTSEGHLPVPPAVYGRGAARGCVA